MGLTTKMTKKKKIVEPGRLGPLGPLLGSILASILPCPLKDMNTLKKKHGLEISDFFKINR